MSTAPDPIDQLAKQRYPDIPYAIDFTGKPFVDRARVGFAAALRAVRDGDPYALQACGLPHGLEGDELSYLREEPF